MPTTFKISGTASWRRQPLSLWARWISRSCWEVGTLQRWQCLQPWHLCNKENMSIEDSFFLFNENQLKLFFPCNYKAASVCAKGNVVRAPRAWKTIVRKPSRAANKDFLRKTKLTLDDACAAQSETRTRVISQRNALTNIEQDVPEARWQVDRDVLVPLLKAVVLADVMQVVTADDDSPLHLHFGHHTCQK